MPRRPGWTENFLNFFCVACKSKSNGLRSVLSFVESMLNKSRVVTCFRPGRAKDFSVPPHKVQLMHRSRQN